MSLAEELRSIAKTELHKREDNVSPVVDEIINDAKQIAQTGGFNLNSRVFHLAPKDGAAVKGRLQEHEFSVNPNPDIVVSGALCWVFRISWS